MRSSTLAALRPLQRPVAFPWRGSRSLYRLSRQRAQHTKPEDPTRVFQDDVAHVRNVRFRRPPFFTRRRFLRITMWSAATYVLMRTLVLPNFAIEVEYADENSRETKESKGLPGAGMEGTEEDEDDEDDIGMFIPFTRAKELPRTWYKGSDPEWQEFIRVANDAELQSALCEKLKALVVTHVPRNRRQLLGSDIEAGKHWIDFTFPDGPPPEHSRDGIMIGNGTLAWGSEIVDHATHESQSRLVWPKEAIESAWASMRFIQGILSRHVRTSLGMTGSSDSKSARADAVADRYLKMIFSKRPAHDGLIENSASSITVAKPSTSGAQSDQTRPWPLSAFANSPFSAASPSSTPEDFWDKSSAHRLALLGWACFQNTFAQKKAKAKSSPPRGAFVLHGLVEVRGSRGRMLFDVYADYLPAQSEFVRVVSMMRNYKPWSQKPRGGDH